MPLSFDCELPMRVVRIRTPAETRTYHKPISVLDMVDEQELAFLKEKLAGLTQKLLQHGFTLPYQRLLLLRRLYSRHKRKNDHQLPAL
jgi:hypothetical protein